MASIDSTSLPCYALSCCDAFAFVCSVGIIVSLYVVVCWYRARLHLRQRRPAPNRLGKDSAPAAGTVLRLYAAMVTQQGTVVYPMGFLFGVIIEAPVSIIFFTCPSPYTSMCLPRQNSYYRSVLSFQADIELVLQNCILYNDDAW